MNLAQLRERWVPRASRARCDVEKIDFSKFEKLETNHVWDPETHTLYRWNGETWIGDDYEKDLARVKNMITRSGATGVDVKSIIEQYKPVGQIMIDRLIISGYFVKTIVDDFSLKSRLKIFPDDPGDC